MIAYLFWHWPDAGAEVAAYEAAQRRFHSALNQAGGEGFQGSLSYRVRGAPWIPGGDGYEDWYLLDGSHALDGLNDLAVAPSLRAAHDGAARAATGAGGLYRLLRGVPRQLDGEVAWASRARGTSSAEFLAGVPGDAVVWRRQMVLGPAPEFLFEVPDPGRPPTALVWRERYC